MVGVAVEVESEAAHFGLLCKTTVIEFFTVTGSRVRTSGYGISRRVEMLVQSQPYTAGGISSLRS